MNPLAAAMALGLHAVVLAGFLPACTGQVRPPPPPASQPYTEDPVFVRIVPGGTLACDHSYVGYGVMTSALGRVIDVAPGSPAEMAFIREGDRIENGDEFSPDTLPIGTQITLRVQRGGVTTAKTLRVALVCYR